MDSDFSFLLFNLSLIYKLDGSIRNLYRFVDKLKGCQKVDFSSSVTDTLMYSSVSFGISEKVFITIFRNREYNSSSGIEQ